MLHGKKKVIGRYQSAGGYFKEGPTVSLKIGGKTLSKTGPNVNSSGSCTTRNTNSYKTNQLKFCQVELDGIKGLTMSNFKNSKLTFIPKKNHASDVTRIVMRYIRAYVEYEDIPAAFNLQSL